MAICLAKLHTTRWFNSNILVCPTVQLSDNMLLEIKKASKKWKPFLFGILRSSSNCDY